MITANKLEVLAAPSIFIKFLVTMIICFLYYSRFNPKSIAQRVDEFLSHFSVYYFSPDSISVYCKISLFWQFFLCFF